MKARDTFLMSTKVMVMTSLLAATMFGQAAQPATQTQTFKIVHAATVQDFQEIANVVRTITEIQKVSTDNAQETLTVTASTDQVSAADWLVQQLDQPAGSYSPGVLEYTGMTETDNKGNVIPNVVRIVYLPHTATVQDFQEAAHAVRTVTEIRRVFTYNAGRAVAIRGTSDQIAM